MKKDNSEGSYSQKVALRCSARRALERAGVDAVSILETHGGLGRLWQRVYGDLPRGVVMEADGVKAAVLACQRPGWAVYEARAETAIAGGVGFHLQPNLFDLDPYGGCWEVLDAIAARHAEWRAGPCALVVNDGGRLKPKLGGGWHYKALAPAVQHFGNDGVYDRYLDVCRWMVNRAAARAGRRVTQWAGYYCGHHDQMTHFAALLDE